MGLTFRPTADGQYSLEGPHHALRNVTAGVRVGPDGRRVQPGRWVAAADGSVEATLPQGLLVTLSARPAPHGDGTLLCLSLRNDGDQAVPVLRLEPLLFGDESELTWEGEQSRPWRVYKQGWQSWSFVGSRGLTEADVLPRFFLTRPAHADPAWAPPRGRGHFQSESMLM
ncbi:MAG: hypothetical protein ACM3XM_12775, partial [Mycobacterium leprae]